MLLFLSVRKISLLVRGQGEDAPQLLHTITQTTQVQPAYPNCSAYVSAGSAHSAAHNPGDLLSAGSMRAY